eukprot:scaffold23961_cov131-Isochrysis_galbana.AAC.4
MAIYMADGCRAAECQQQHVQYAGPGHGDGGLEGVLSNEHPEVKPKHCLGFSAHSERRPPPMPSASALILNTDTPVPPYPRALPPKAL